MLGLIALPSAVLACAALSVVESRLNGNPLCWTASPATAFPKACASGGKSALAASPRSVGQAELTPSPASPPVPYGVGLEVHLGGRPTVGEEGIGLQEQHQLGALTQLIGDGPLPHDALGLLDKGGGKEGTIPW